MTSLPYSTLIMLVLFTVQFCLFLSTSLTLSFFISSKRKIPLDLSAHSPTTCFRVFFSLWHSPHFHIIKTWLFLIFLNFVSDSGFFFFPLLYAIFPFTVSYFIILLLSLDELSQSFNSYSTITSCSFSCLEPIWLCLLRNRNFLFPSTFFLIIVWFSFAFKHSLSDVLPHVLYVILISSLCYFAMCSIWF